MEKTFVECKRVRINGNREYRYFMKEGVSFEEKMMILSI